MSEPSDDAVQAFREIFASFTDPTWLASLHLPQRNEDGYDAAIARERLAEIEINPETVLRGDALEKKLKEWQA